MRKFHRISTGGRSYTHTHTNTTTAVCETRMPALTQYHIEIGRNTNTKNCGECVYFCSTSSTRARTRRKKVPLGSLIHSRDFRARGQPTTGPSAPARVYISSHTAHTHTHYVVFCFVRPLTQTHRHTHTRIPTSRQFY